MPGPTVLCPIDFSDASRGALRYAVAIAAYAGCGVTILTVNDPLLAQAAEMAGAGSLDPEARAELERFFHDTFTGKPPGVPHQLAVATGKPAEEILRFAGSGGITGIVMSSRGATGIRKLFLGSTTERVLRETRLPVVVTPPEDAGPASLDDLRTAVRRILVPLDMGAAMDQQVTASRQLAGILGVPLLLVNVIEPVRAVVPGHVYAANVDSERRDRAEQRLQAMVDDLDLSPAVEALVFFGEPAEEIAKIAADRHAGLIVMGLHASALLGPRMGSVTYRVLSLSHILVLALPPASA